MEEVEKRIFGKIVIVPRDVVVVFEVNPCFLHMSGGKNVCAIIAHVHLGVVKLSDLQTLVLSMELKDVFLKNKKIIQEKTASYLRDCYKKGSISKEELAAFIEKENFLAA